MLIETSQLDSVLWDYDGVIIDESKSYIEAIRQTAARILQRTVTMEEIRKVKSHPGLNCHWDATYALITGVEDVNMVDRDSDQYLEIQDIFQTIFLGSKLFQKLDGGQADIDVEEGTIETETLLATPDEFALLAGKYKKMGIVTGRPRNILEYSLQKHAIEKYFQYIVAKYEAKREKPHPDSIIMAMQGLGVERPIYIGDSPSDVQAAQRAGIPCIYIGDYKIEDETGVLRLASTREAVQFLLS